MRKCEDCKVEFKEGEMYFDDVCDKCAIKRGELVEGL